MILTLTNQKGGVGKTTSAVNIAAAAARAGHRVLLVDLDPQFAASRQAGLSVGELEQTVVEAITGDVDPGEAIVRDHHGVDWLPGHPDLARVEHTLARQDLGTEFVLQTLRDGQLDQHYELVVIDCPPNLGQLSLNGIAAADRLLVPVSGEDEGAAQGLLAVRSTLEELELSTPLDVILTRTNRQRVVQRLITDALDAQGFPAPLASIPSRALIQQAAAQRVPLVLSHPDCLPSTLYRSLTADLMETR